MDLNIKKPTVKQIAWAYTKEHIDDLFILIGALCFCVAIGVFVSPWVALGIWGALMIGYGFLLGRIST